MQAKVPKVRKHGGQTIYSISGRSLPPLPLPGFSPTYTRSIDRGRLYRIEKGLINPYPEEVHLMADLYNAPELRNYYCTGMCPLGCEMPKADVTNLDRITVQAIASFRRLNVTEEILLDITEDGVITEDEKPDMQKVLEELGELEAVTQNLRIWVKKNL